MSFVARVPLHGLVRRRGTIAEFAKHEVSTYTLPELAAGKFFALLSRSIPRDRYDAARLMELERDLPDNASFRVAFTCQTAASRSDCRSWSATLAPLSTRDMQQTLVPTLRRSSRDLTAPSRPRSSASSHGATVSVRSSMRSWTAARFAPSS